MIDLHSHTNESDGTFAPAELIAEAKAIGLEALAITDHDTFAGYDAALPLARAVGLELICGVELSTKLHGRSVHLLGYFLDGQPAAVFREWLSAMQESRRDRNRRLIERLRSFGVEISLEEVEAKGRSLTGRPHFARVLVQKGYVPTYAAAFDEYLDESAKAYVDRHEPSFAEAVERIAAGGGISSIAHPVRMGNRATEAVIGEMRDLGLEAVEAHHSDHGPAESERYLAIASKLGLRITGGSDFHGAVKPDVRLGTGRDGNLNVPRRVLDDLRLEISRH